MHASHRLHRAVVLGLLALAAACCAVACRAPRSPAHAPQQVEPYCPYELAWQWDSTPAAAPRETDATTAKDSVLRATAGAFAIVVERIEVTEHHHTVRVQATDTRDGRVHTTTLAESEVPIETLELASATDGRFAVLSAPDGQHAVVAAFEDGFVRWQRQLSWLSTDAPFLLAANHDGWTALGGHDELDVVRMGRDGAEEERLAFGQGYGFVSARSGNAVAIAHSRWADGIKTLELLVLDADAQALPRPHVIDRDGAPAIDFVVIKLLPAPDGWWLAVGASWQSHHFSSAPSQLRFIKTRPDGSAAQRLYRRPPFALLDLRADAAGLHGNVSGRPFTVRPGRTCLPSPSSPCDPALAAGPRGLSDAGRFDDGDVLRWIWTQEEVTEEEAPQEEVTHQGEDDLGDLIGTLSRTTTRLDLQRERPDGRAVWTQPVFEFSGDNVAHYAYLPGASAVEHGRVIVFTSENGLRMTTLDARTGARIRQRVLHADLKPWDVCSLHDAQGWLLGVPDHSGLYLFDLETRGRDKPLMVIPEAWDRCALVRTSDALYLGATRIEAEGSGGPETSLHIHRLSSDGKVLTRTLSPANETGEGLQMLAHARGLTLAWFAFGGWDVRTWELNAAGAPTGLPRPLTTLYYFPEYKLEYDGQRAHLLWTTRTEHGDVPICRK